MGRKEIIDKKKPVVIWIRESEIKIIGKSKDFDKALKVTKERMETAAEKMVIEADELIK